MALGHIPEVVLEILWQWLGLLSCALGRRRQRAIFGDFLARPSVRHPQLANTTETPWANPSFRDSDSGLPRNFQENSPICSCEIRSRDFRVFFPFSVS